MYQLLTQDDYGYRQFNERIFDVNIPMDMDGISEGSDEQILEEDADS